MSLSCEGTQQAALHIFCETHWKQNLFGCLESLIQFKQKKATNSFIIFEDHFVVAESNHPSILPFLLQSLVSPLLPIIHLSFYLLNNLATQQNHNIRWKQVIFYCFHEHQKSFHGLSIGLAIHS